MRAHRGGRLVASIARHALPPRSVVGGLESIPVATCAKTPGRAPTSSTMATRFAATRVPLSARRPGELRPCKLAPASRAERPTRSPAHCPSASCPLVRTGGRANLSCPRHIGVRCIPQLVAPIDARVGGLHPRDERSRHLDSGWSRPHGRTPAWPMILRHCGICIHIED